MLYGSGKEDVMLVANATDFFIENSTNTSWLHTLSFCHPAKLVLKDFREVIFESFVVLGCI